jgi:hypothetical protein
MRSAGIRHDANRRLSDVGQMLDLADVVRAHLDDRVAMRRSHLEQHQRHADVVV